MRTAAQVFLQDEVARATDQPVVGHRGATQDGVGLQPLLGCGNWFLIPFAAVGALIAAIALLFTSAGNRGRAKTGLVLNGLVIVVGVLRLTLGGGIIESAFDKAAMHACVCMRWVRVSGGGISLASAPCPTPASSTQATARVPLQRCDTASQRVLRRMAGVN